MGGGGGFRGYCRRCGRGGGGVEVCLQEERLEAAAGAVDALEHGGRAAEDGAGPGGLHGPVRLPPGHGRAHLAHVPPPELDREGLPRHGRLVDLRPGRGRRRGAGASVSSQPPPTKASPFGPPCIQCKPCETTPLRADTLDLTAQRCRYPLRSIPLHRFRPSFDLHRRAGATAAGRRDPVSEGEGRGGDPMMGRPSSAIR